MESATFPEFETVRNRSEPIASPDIPLRWNANLAQIAWRFIGVTAMKSAGGESAVALRLLAQKHPQIEMRMHRLHRTNEEFRSLCDDHFTAVKAFEYWGAAGDVSKAGEFRQLADEFEALILRALV
jgi:hypothetical protein